MAKKLIYLWSSCVVMACLTGCQTANHSTNTSAPTMPTGNALAPYTPTPFGTPESVPTMPTVEVTGSASTCLWETMDEVIFVGNNEIAAFDPDTELFCTVDDTPGARFGGTATVGPVSPDRRWLAYVIPGEVRESQRRSQLVIVDLTANQRKIYAIPGYLDANMWLSDSQRLVLNFHNGHNNSSILFDSLQGTYTVLKEQFPDDYRLREISPDDQWALYLSGDGRSEPVDLVMEPLLGGQGTYLTDDALREFWVGWSPDGEWILIISTNEATQDTSTPSWIGCFPIADKAYLWSPLSNERRDVHLGQNPVYISGFSPDGSKLLYENPSGEACAGDVPLCILDIETGQNQCIESQGMSPIWSPDGERLAFVGDYPDDPDCMRLNIYDIRSDAIQASYVECYGYTLHWTRLKADSATNQSVVTPAP